MKFAVGITLYNPADENIRHIKEYVDLFDKVFIYDNSEPDFIKTYKFEYKNVFYISYNRNDGLPFAYNRILDSEEIIDCDYLCTLDQDSVFTKENIKKIQDYIKENKDILKEKTGIVAPFISYNGEFPKSETIVEKERVITSGSFLNLYLINKFKLRYDEKYFIDKFEIDLCKQIRNLSFSIKIYNGSILKQRLGDDLGKGHSNHSALRHYYLFRNRFYFNNKFYPFIVCWIMNILQIIRHLFKIVFIENDSINKVKQLFLAYNDYSNGKMGKRETRINNRQSKRIYYVTGLDVNSWGEGIQKKIRKHIDLLKNEFNTFETIYMSLERKQSRLLKIIRTVNPFMSTLDYKKLYDIKGGSILFIRYMGLNYFLLSAIRNLAKNNVKIVIEIPTYPYDRETSNIISKINNIQDRLCRKYLYKYVSRIITYSDDEYIWGIKTIKISNAVDVDDNYEIKPVNTDSINMLAVASLAFWHGYDRLIQGLNNYYKNGGKRKVYFHLVGDGKYVLDEYKKLVKRLKIDNSVIFHGRKSGKELDDIYTKCNLGIDSLGRHRSGVTYNSSIKGKEYLLKGLPIISGVKTELDSLTECAGYYYRVPADDSPININDVIVFFDKVYQEDSLTVRKTLRNYAKHNFDFSITFKPVIDYIRTLSEKEL